MTDEPLVKQLSSLRSLLHPEHLELQLRARELADQIDQLR